MSDLIACSCCGTKPQECPSCGKPGKIYAPNLVGCSDAMCGWQVDFGHHCGTQGGIPAVHYVISRWNTRREVERLRAEVERAVTASDKRLRAEVEMLAEVTRILNVPTPNQWHEMCKAAEELRDTLKTVNWIKQEGT